MIGRKKVQGQLVRNVKIVKVFQPMRLPKRWEFILMQYARVLRKAI